MLPGASLFLVKPVDLRDRQQGSINAEVWTTIKSHSWAAFAVRNRISPDFPMLGSSMLTG